ncbi:ergothioneine biosynthesis glutamate--cysteine ligase EgtA, partial [Streptomyces sp. SID5998]|nr:ergothioneine biosynthesis glutamate--cysteine ligase EgtA [Streptomyces sp. SID5998]
CFLAALEALPRLGASDEVVRAVRGHLDRYVLKGRCPADDLLDRLPGPDPARTRRPGPAGTGPFAHGKDIRT